MARRTISNRLEQFRKLNTLYKTYLKYIGLWMLDSDSPILLRCLYYIYNKLVIIIIFLFEISVLLDIYLNFDDFLVVTDNVCVFVGVFMIFFKMLIFQAHREQIARLLHATIKSCDQLCKLTTGGEYEILNKYLLICRVISVGFGFILCFFLAFALLFFVSVEDGALLIRARYLLNISLYPCHEIEFFMEVYTIYVVLIAITGIDSMQLTIGMLSLAQFEILNKHFESCGRDNVGRRREVSTEVNCDEDNYESYEARHRGGFAEWFGRSVRDHQRLRVIIDDFNKIYNMCMFVQMLLSITMICLTSFQLLLVTGQSSTFKFSLYLIAAAMQIFFVCWLGNEVMYQSALLTQSQWLSGWEDELSNTKTGRLLILSMIFSTRTLNIKAGVFYDLNMETFTTVLKGAYSVFVLLNMYSEDQ
ncbi:ObirOr5-B1 [Ooceraea biroi]|uniref:Odorant receptor n=1 Tax=Ooceraea biroi TaxID=2015173 RepID=A0A026WTA1_OOCBI|nr:hypothetical protein X777_01291 [Ooceraea biroi]RLU21520.1 ObirOr5-B1 [Ooceraea biroi]